MLFPDFLEVVGTVVVEVTAVAEETLIVAVVTVAEVGVTDVRFGIAADASVVAAHFAAETAENDLVDLPENWWNFA